MEKILKSIRNIRYNHGGRDNTYVLWYAVKKLGLMTFTYFVDNRFVPEQARMIVKRATERLGIELITKSTAS